MPTRSHPQPVLDLSAVCRQPVAALLEARLGRRLGGRLLSQDTITRVRPPGLGKLLTTGPVVHRHVVLEDSLPPGLPVAVAWALFVSERLPVSVRVGLAGTGEPLDRLLTGHQLPWTAELAEDATTGAASQASAHFAWAPAGTPLLDLTRLLHVAGEPVAILIDEVPLLPWMGAAAPLTPQPR
jgi:hypothetical protein